MRKTGFSKLGGRGPQSQRHSRALLQSAGSQGCPQLGVRDPAPLPATPCNGKARTEELRRLQGSALCKRVNGGRSILPKATRTVDTGACLKPIFPGAVPCSPREVRRWAAVWEDKLHGDQ